ncbi:DEAD/DEAH box helicase [uncultured Subdoligranulum sp.]|uniref:DEAD/DEAH box helicase n=1 Tax=uncultured Subdoligranulum sp. TaxID=512298 RepID=UPI0025FC4AF2|nr:DEAD/DEAH box helicase [uncultured Subdoligranulum sp.]
MKIKVYKGFNKEYLEKIKIEKLLDTKIEDKINVLKLDEDYADLILGEILAKKNNDINKEYWITYEEFTLAYEEIISRVRRGKINSIDIIENNIYPNAYPINLELTDEQYNKYLSIQDGDRIKYDDEILRRINEFYTDIFKINDVFYGTYNNYEIPFNPDINSIIKIQNCEITELESEECDFLVKIGDDIEEYLKYLEQIKNSEFEKIGYIKYAETDISNMVFETFKAFLCNNGKNVLYKYKGQDDLEDKALENELKEIGKNLIGNDFEFFPIDFYKNPDANDNELEIVSQSEIMKYIVQEAEKAYNGEIYRDIFMTAPTGAGKSIIFQVPSIYLAEKYKKLIIIIEPLKGLMDEQKSELEKKGYKKVAFLNSDIPTPLEKEKIIKGVKDGEIDILYISPETLISRSLETLIGDREIGLIVVDEAHIVTSWGVGFRPDYWYLGKYLYKFRRTQDNRGKAKKAYKFPIFACTATAVFGGKDDTVWETVDSLNMLDPIIRIGSAKRKNISFQIQYKPKTTYDAKIESKNDLLKNRIENWIKNKEKTIVYCPYKSIAHKMYDATSEFKEFGKFKGKVGIYTGDDSEYDIDKHELVNNFKEGKINVIYATKAFGMGMNVKDIKNVYHYAITGNLNDYVQEIGRAARNEKLVPQGKAIIDYYEEDFKYMNSLFGMSQIKQYQVKKCLSIIYDTYKNKGKEGFLVNPKMFSSAFGLDKEKDEQAIADNLNIKIKIVLLMLEKDLREKQKTSVLKTTPNGYYTKTYVLVKEPFVNEVEKGIYSKYFKKINNDIKKEIIINDYKNENSDIISYDNGNTYEFDMKTIWEELYSDNMSFAAFKYHFYNKTGKVMEDIYEAIVPKVKLTINPKNIDFEHLYTKLNEEIDYLVKTLSGFGTKFFSLEQFKNIIQERYKKDVLANTIAYNFIDIVNPNAEGIMKRQSRISLNPGKIRNLSNKLINKSILLKKLRNCKENTYKNFYLENDTDNRILKLLSSLDLITYEIEGGNTPEIYIFLNAPDKIKRIVEDKIVYRNSYVIKAREKHYRAVKILEYFLKYLKNNDERWDFIEKYFLGVDVEEEIINQNKNFVEVKSKNEPLEKYINQDKKIELSDYENWDEIIDNLFNESVRENKIIGKYRYFCNLLKKTNKRIPDYVHTELKLGSNNNIIKVETLFIYLDENIVILPETYKEIEKKKCTEYGWKVIIVDELEKNLNFIEEENNG